MRVFALVAVLAAVAVIAGTGASGCDYMRHPTPTTMWGKPDGVMVLGIETRGNIINVFLQNRSKQIQLIVAKGFMLTIEPAEGAAGVGAGPRQVVDTTHVALDKDESFEKLKPGESLATPMGVSKLPPGTYQVSAAYHPTGGGAWWTGSLTAGPITFVKQ